jgi:hypothetical protein
VFLRNYPGEILTLQAILGHARLETTRDYRCAANLERAVDQVADLACDGRAETSGAIPSGEEAASRQIRYFGRRWTWRDFSHTRRRP